MQGIWLPKHINRCPRTSRVGSFDISYRFHWSDPCPLLQAQNQIPGNSLPISRVSTSSESRRCSFGCPTWGQFVQHSSHVSWRVPDTKEGPMLGITTLHNGMILSTLRHQLSWLCFRLSQMASYQWRWRCIPYL